MYFKLKTWYLVIVPILCFFNLLIDLYFTYLRNEEKVKIVSLSTILRIIIELTLSIFFVILLLIGWKGRIFSLILSTTIIAVVAFIYLYRKKIFIFYFDINFLRKEIPFWISILVGFIFIISFNTFDKYIIKYYCTEYELGDYSLASQFGFIILTFSSAVNSAYHPNLFKDLSESRPLSIIYKKILMLIGVNFIISIISIILVYLLMKYFINYRYANAWKYYYIIAMVYFMWSCIMILYGFIGYFKLKKVLFYLGFFSLIFFIPIQIIGAYLYKINGILYSQFLYLTLCFVSLTIYLNKKIKKNYQT
jgi:O-antigen/teichoic acid export membrane protein